MPTFPCLLIPALAAGLLTCSAAGAAGFEYVGQSRTVSMAGTLSLSSYDTNSGASASKGFYESAADWDFGVWDAAVGLSDFSISSAAGAVDGAGRAAQHSALEPDRIFFDGFTDAFVGGYSSNGTASGSAGATTGFAVSFFVEETTRVRLDMSGTFDIDGVFSQYQFQLSRDGGAVVWDRTYIEDPIYGPLTSFSRGLTLQAGSYSLYSSLATYGWFEGASGQSGQATAVFTLTAVPEPASWVLLGAGVAVLGLRRRRL